MSDAVWTHRWHPTRLPRPWDFSGKNTGVGCHGLLHSLSWPICKTESGLPRWLRERIHLPMQETRVQYPDREDPLEEEIATHSSILAWKIPWTEESGRLQSMGFQKRLTWLSKKKKKQRVNAKGLIRQLIVNLQPKGAITITTKDGEFQGLPWWSVSKTSPSSAGGVRSVMPGQGIKIPHASGPKAKT